MRKGYIQIYTGEGKGKTTAAIGLAVRAAGSGLKIYFGQFMKGQDYGELHSLAKLPEVTHEQFGDPGWVRQGQIKPEQIELARKGLERAKSVLSRGDYDLVILDELNMALWFGLLELSAVEAVLRCRPERTELVLTGRRAHDRLIELGDLVTEMKPIKHYYDTQKVPARRGIEN